ncbi:MAG TPA: DUF4159 domain-containing protein [Vicinamibacterales bacterium]
MKSALAGVAAAAAVALGGAAVAQRATLAIDPPASDARAAIPVLRAADGTPVALVAPARQDLPKTPYNGRFVFTRIQYDMGGGTMGRFFGRRGDPPWHHDHPSAEYNFARILEALSYVPPSIDQSNILTLDDERIFLYPILYMVEPGYWRPTETEMVRLREHLLKGGMIIFDDFDDRQFFVLEQIFQRVLPELAFAPIMPDDPVFDSFFQIDPRELHFGAAGYRGDQIDFQGIHEDNDPSRRLLVIAGNRGDLGEFWEFSDVGFFPVDITNEAYKVGVNYIVYGMTH